MGTKLSKVVTYCEMIPLLKSHGFVLVTWQIDKIIISSFIILMAT